MTVSPLVLVNHDYVFMVFSVSPNLQILTCTAGWSVVDRTSSEPKSLSLHLLPCARMNLASRNRANEIKSF